MTRKGRRRLDIWLTEDHPIFLYPPGSRAQVARDWLDIGERLSRLEEKINRIQMMGDSFPEKNIKKHFDPVDFAKVINDAFS
jgi:hypothetical protein